MRAIFSPPRFFLSFSSLKDLRYPYRLLFYEEGARWSPAATWARREHINTKEGTMTESVYKIIELVGSSPVSWEEAAKNAVNSAGLTLRDLRIAEVQTLDMKIDGDKPVLFRAKVKLSFKLVSD
jgi:dodecin